MYEGAHSVGIEAAATARVVATPRPRPFVEQGTLVGGAFWLVSSNLLYAVCQWTTVVALAKVGATSLGHFGVALAVATPIVLLTGFALRAYQATDVVQRFGFVDYLALRLVANVVAAAILGAIAFGM